MAADLPTSPSLLMRLRDASDGAAWSQFVSLYTPLIFGVCRARGLSEADAGDVAQEVLRAVAGAMGRFDYDPGRSTFRNWLFTVVRSKLNTFLSARARRPQLAGETTYDQFLRDEADHSFEEAWQREYQANLLRWAADRIQPEFQSQTWDAFWRTAIQGEAAEAVAAQLGLSLNALYIARSRVTGRLKQMIQTVEDDASATEGFAHG